jgi:hypothetical protein
MVYGFNRRNRKYNRANPLDSGSGHYYLLCNPVNNGDPIM